MFLHSDDPEKNAHPAARRKLVMEDAATEVMPINI